MWWWWMVVVFGDGLKSYFHVKQKLGYVRLSCGWVINISLFRVTYHHMFSAPP